MTAIAELDNRPSIILVVDPPNILPCKTDGKKLWIRNNNIFHFILIVLILYRNLSSI